MEIKITLSELSLLYDGVNELSQMKASLKFSIKIAKFRRLELVPKMEILEEQVIKLKEEVNFQEEFKRLLKEKIEVNLINISEEELQKEEDEYKDKGFVVSPLLLEKLHYIIV